MALRKTTNKVAAHKATAPTKRTNGGSRKAATTTKATKARVNTRASTKATEAVLNQTGRPRLGKGGLEAQVLDHLRAHRRVEFTSTELSHKLDRSGGAILNALEKFVGQGVVVRTSDKPRRYRYASAKATRRANGTTKSR
ncbi:MAG TPA: winged helix DNA-binding protein [Acidimicrobiales bacterium]|nr:winged helix DNA-binding protein [Acidimicrobiales bacterium]